MKDTTGNPRSVFTTIGASNHSSFEKPTEDFYATDPKAAELLLKEESFDHNIWECACGEKHLSKVFESHGYNVRSSDIVDRCGNEVYDFLGMENQYWDGDIITNPPYKAAAEFVEKALSIIPDGRKIAMFLKLTFLEGKSRRELFRHHPPKTVYVSSSRLNCARNGDFKSFPYNSAVAYAWFVWQKGFKGNTIVKWIN